jgi:hypothetical protein
MWCKETGKLRQNMTSYGVRKGEVSHDPLVQKSTKTKLEPVATQSHSTCRFSLQYLKRRLRAWCSLSLVTRQGHVYFFVKKYRLAAVRQADTQKLILTFFTSPSEAKHSTRRKDFGPPNFNNMPIIPDRVVWRLPYSWRRINEVITWKLHFLSPAWDTQRYAESTLCCGNHSTVDPGFHTSGVNPIE